MIGLLTAFFSSFIGTLMIIRFNHLHRNLTADSNLTGPQKFHKNIVPRIGGLAIALGLFLGILANLKDALDINVGVLLLLSAIPAFAIGIAEDVTKRISVRRRLFFTAISAGLMIHLSGVSITRLDIPILDLLFSIPFVGALFAIFAITGLSNAYNIIDGFHGLSSMVGIITLLGIAYISFVLGDLIIVHLSLIMASALLGFFIWNYPRGLIFLGDGGAYLIGFWIAALSVLLVYRHQEISPWFALLINAYPIIETLFTVYRRKIHQGKSPGHPDGLHLHSLLFRRILKPSHIPNEMEWYGANAKTSPYLWIISSLAIIPSIFFWNSSIFLIGFLILFILAYIWLYSRMVTFRTPR